MKVGVCEATELKKRSEMLSIPFADLLWGYAVEDLMLRVSTSAYREFLWLMSLPLLGEEAYRQRAKKRIRFFYKGSEEELTPDKLQPGQRLSIAMGEHIKTTLFAKENAQKIHWEGTVTALSGGIRLSMTAGYFDMKVPLNIEIYSFGAISQIPGTREEELIAVGGGRTISYLVYSPESELSYDLFAIMDKLELIGSMGSYYDAYRLYLLACERYVDEACADVRIFRCAQVKHIVHDTVAYVGACGEGYVARKAVFADVLNHCFATVFRFCSFVISAVNLNRFMHAPPKSLSFTHML